MRKKKPITYDVNENGCHICTSHSRDRGGYARINYNGVKMGVHKMLYLKRHGEKSIPPNHVLLHSCDNPSCINVDHLTVGTHKDNMRDMAEKGRAKGSRGKVLTEQQKINIMKSAKTNNELSKKYGVTERYIQKIRNGTR